MAATSRHGARLVIGPQAKQSGLGAARSGDRNGCSAVVGAEGEGDLEYREWGGGAYGQP